MRPVGVSVSHHMNTQSYKFTSEIKLVYVSQVALKSALRPFLVSLCYVMLAGISSQKPLWNICDLVWFVLDRPLPNINDKDYEY